MKNDIDHRVMHYYYTGWPDFAVVEPRNLLDLIEKVHSYGRNRIQNDSSPPMVVHCRYELSNTPGRNPIVRVGIRKRVCHSDSSI